MPFVSVTRLRPRSLFQLPRVMFHSWTSSRQIRRTQGFLGGYLATSPGPALWTVTLWESEDSMRAFRGSGAHQKAMPILIRSCSEAAVAHWTLVEPLLPPPDIAAERLGAGRLSKVRNPSSAHAAGQCWPDGKIPLRGPALIPAY